VSNYVQSTNFATKDALSSGDPLKIVKGTEINTEFNNIATAVATKADLASPTFTGTPAAPTASVGVSTTQIASTAFVQAALQTLHPVGSIYINATNATNPGTLLGFGTWTAFGAGRVPVGFDASDSSFNSAEETGGSKNAIVVSHKHSVTDPGHFHDTETILRANYDISGGSSGYGQDSPTGTGPDVASKTATTGITINSAGSSGTNANLQPYITVYMWKRTA